MDRAEVGVLKQRNQVGLCRLLEGEHRLALESHLLLELSGDLSHKALERQLPDEQVGLSYKRCTLFWNFLISLRATVPGLNL